GDLRSLAHRDGLRRRGGCDCQPVAVRSAGGGIHWVRSPQEWPRGPLPLGERRLWGIWSVGGPRAEVQGKQFASQGRVSHREGALIELLRREPERATRAPQL